MLGAKMIQRVGINAARANRASVRLLAGAAHKRLDKIIPDPARPTYNVAMVGVTAAPKLNTDKTKDGMRYDAVPIINGVKKAGCSCEYLDYADFECKQAFKKKVQSFDGVIVRTNPGHLPAAEQDTLDNIMQEVANQGTAVWPSPIVKQAMGAKTSLVKMAHLNVGLGDTYCHYTPKDLFADFRRTLTHHPRVLKQNRGSTGTGIWLVWREGGYGKDVEGGETLKLMEMNDNHVEYHTVEEFENFCVHGPGGKAGSWNSAQPGRYFDGGLELGSYMVNQRLLPRIVEGEVRMFMINDTLTSIIHKVPKDGLSAVGTNADVTIYPPNAPQYKVLREGFVQNDVPVLLKAFDLEDQQLPLIWTADFIPVDGPQEFAIVEINCSCVGLSSFLEARSATNDMTAVSDANFQEGTVLADLIGVKAAQAMDNIHG
eukprot:NODE_306_length_1683_cov_480.421990.p1 GENE.NODE_306_length_1683_cov_480.421990~~NODE_306_length_1683_cov_480.421990.p1  ORF type:complete len:459 (-),score=137.47 NODE_306_length_1683_cov_480.421990:293-1579(-)